MPTEVRTTARPLDFYIQPAVMTSVCTHAPLFYELPSEVSFLATVVQGLLVHEHLAPAYGVTLSDELRSSVHIRPVEHIVERIMEEDDRPLTTARSPETRVAGNCRHVTVMKVAMLRAQGVPARA